MGILLIFINFFRNKILLRKQKERLWSDCWGGDTRCPPTAGATRTCAQNTGERNFVVQYSCIIWQFTRSYSFNFIIIITITGNRTVLYQNTERKNR